MKKYFQMVAKFIGIKLGLSFEEREVLAFGLEVSFLILTSLFSALLLGLWWNIVPEILVVAAVWMLIRSFAGGAHLSTLWRCALFSTLAVAALGGAASFIASSVGHKGILALILFCGAAALFITSLWAPADNAKKRIAQKERQNFRRKAVIAELSLILFLLAVYFLAGEKYSSLLCAASLSMGAETLTVSPGGYRAIAFLDRLLALFEMKALRR